MAATSGPEGSGQQLARELYRWRAWCYDWQLAPYEGLRGQAIAALGLQAGQTVLDVGCGTGLSLPRLSEQVGAEGRVIGIDLCPEMLAVASERVRGLALNNVELVCAPIEAAQWQGLADAALFHFTHDILQSDAALTHVIEGLAPRAHVVATGLQWTAQAWTGLNASVWWSAMQSITRPDGLEQPWKGLSSRLHEVSLQSLLFGTIYQLTGLSQARWSGTPPPRHGRSRAGRSLKP